MPPLGKPDRDWLKNQIQEAVQLALQKGNETDDGKLSKWMKDYGALSAIATVIVGIPALILAIVTILLPEWKQYTEFRVRTEDRIDIVNKRLETIEKDLQTLRLIDSIKNISSSDAKTFSKSLPALRKMLEQPAPRIKDESALLQQLAAKLRETNETAPEYWPTVMQFIQFASTGISQNAPPPGPPTILVQNFRNATINQAHAVVTLDGGSLLNSTFTNCRIIFTEKPVGMNNVRFIDCVFEMPISVPPTPYLKQTSRQLLASSLESVTMQIIPPA